MGYVRIQSADGRLLYDSRHEELDEKTLDYVTWYDRALIRMRDQINSLRLEARKLDKRTYGNKGKRVSLAWSLIHCRNGLRNIRKLGYVAIKNETELATHRDLANRGIIPHRDEDLS